MSHSIAITTLEYKILDFKRTIYTIENYNTVHQPNAIAMYQGHIEKLEHAINVLKENDG